MFIPPENLKETNPNSSANLPKRWNAAWRKNIRTRRPAETISETQAIGEKAAGRAKEFHERQAADSPLQLQGDTDTETARLACLQERIAHRLEIEGAVISPGKILRTGIDGDAPEREPRIRS